MNHERMSFLDFFAGIGTIRIGFEQAGWTCNGHVEWDKFAQASYNAMHEIKEDEYCGWDITKVRADELPRADLWAFGAPCQDFSIAGNRQGLKGERSSLVYEIFRLIEETPEENRPTWLLYENVKGMLSSNGGWDFLGILLEMDRLGYDVEWQLLNSKDWGVPQNRERVFTLGNLRGRGGRKVFPIGREGEETDNEIKQIGQYDTDRRKNSNRFRVYSGDGVAPTIGTMGGGGLEPCVAIPVITPDRVKKRQNGRRFKEDGEPMFTLTAQDRHGVAILRPKRTDYGKQIRKQYEAGEVKESRHNMTTLEPVFDGVSNTITTVQKDNLLMVNEPKVIDDQGRVKDSYKQHDIVPTLRAQTHGNPPKVTVIEEAPTLRSSRHGVAVGGIYTKSSEKFQRGMLDGESRTIKASQHDAGVVLNSDNGFRIRKLTPKECWRLQGVPDHYFDKASAVNSDSQLYKQAGNACTVNVIFEVARRIGREETA